MMEISPSQIHNKQSKIDPSFNNDTNNDNNFDDLVFRQNQLQQKNNSPELTLSKHRKIPRVSSEILFQSDTLSDDNEEITSTSLLENNPSMQIPLFINCSNDSIPSSSGSIEDFNSIINSSKLSQFPPEIEINDYFEDLLRREANAPHSKTEEELLTYMNYYSIENYANSHFRKQIGAVFSNNQAIKELTTFSNKPLSKPLLEKTPLTKKSTAIRINNYILVYIDVLIDKAQEEIYKGRRDEYKNDLTIGIVKMLHDEDDLIDEFYMQMIKAMRNSPNHETLLLSWNLFIIILSLFYVKNRDVSNVIRWFLITSLVEKDDFCDYAHYAFICFHERNVLENNFDYLSMAKKDIVRIPLNVHSGIKMFKCSLYTQMWNQRRKYPKLPIPLTLYLAVKALIKNGVMFTPNPFPNLGRKLPKSVNSRASNQTPSQKEDESEIESSDKNIISYEENSHNNSSDKSIDNHNNDNHEDTDNDDNNHNHIDNHIKDVNDNNSNHNNDDNSDSNNHNNKDSHIMNSDNQNNHNNNSDINNNNKDNHIKDNYNNNCCCYRKADMKIVQMWSSNLNQDYEIINDGEVCNLLGFVLMWMINLLDPIVPKSMTNSFIEIFKKDGKNDPTYNEKCRVFLANLPLLHMNTLKFLVGFFRDIVRNGKYTHETKQSISENLGFYFVETSFMTIDPFTRKVMHDISPNFLLYCLDNLDVSDVYPLNPIYEICING